jgi:NAD(P)-dependent dehydrogenase (short-subunit alcohol dehydrogenase family)
MLDLSGKVAIVTGASRGIGQAVAVLLAARGAHVVAAARGDHAGATAAAIQDAGGRADAASLDVTDTGAVEAMVGGALERHGRIDILVNNAGTAWGSPAEDMKPEHWHKVLETNLTGTFLCAQAVGQVMIRQKRGAIVNMASVAALGGAPPDLLRAAGYQASKGGVVALTRGLACEWARHGVRVNAIAPGWFPTDMSKKALEMGRERMLEGIPLQRFGGQDDLKGAVAFLASPASAYVTGQLLVVDGGLSAW